MRATILYGPRDVRFEERDAPTIIEPTDAIIRISATCVCGSDLWPLPWHQPGRRADPDGARVLRDRRGGRQRGHLDQARPVRHRFLLRLRQHLSTARPATSRPASTRSSSAGRRRRSVKVVYTRTRRGPSARMVQTVRCPSRFARARRFRRVSRDPQQLLSSSPV